MGPEEGDKGNHDSDAGGTSRAPPAGPPARSESSAASSSTAHSAVESQLRTLLELTRVLVPARDGGDAAASAVPEYLYSSVGLYVRELYEALGDAQRAQQLAQRRKGANPEQISTMRLRALERFVLQVVRAGLSVMEQKSLYEFLAFETARRPAWPRMPVIIRP